MSPRRSSEEVDRLGEKARQALIQYDSATFYVCSSADHSPDKPKSSKTAFFK
jgi:hypothetical protein